MRDFSADHRWLSINTATVRRQRGQEWPLLQILEACAARGIRAVSPWRDQVGQAGLTATRRAVKAHGLELSGYCRGGMFTYADGAQHAAVRDDNRRALDEACELGAACLVLVVGGLPGALAGRALHKDLDSARRQVAEGVQVLPDDATGAFIEARRVQERVHLAQIERLFAGLHRVRVTRRASDVQGVAGLQAIATAIVG